MLAVPMNFASGELSFGRPAERRTKFQSQGQPLIERGLGARRL